MHALAAAITADHLPDTGWADQLRRADPDLARQLAVWRAATSADDHPNPLGPSASPAPQERLRLRELLAAHLPDHDLDPQLDAGPSRIRAPEGVRPRGRDHLRTSSIGR